MNQTPLSTIFEGDVSLNPGSDISQFGYGDLMVNRRGWFYGTEDSVTPTSGTLVSYGGLGVSGDAQFGNNINVLYGTSYLTETLIDTTNGLMSVTGGNKVYIQVGDSSQFITTGGNLTLSSLSRNTFINGGLNANNAVQITATDPAGGVTIQSGNGVGAVSLISGSGGVSAFSSSGNITLTSNNGNTSIVNNTYVDNQNISLQLAGTTDSQISITSNGTNATRSAIYISTTHTAGNINITNNNGVGNGNINILSASGGINMTTNTGGVMNLTTQGADTNILLKSNSLGQTMSIGIQNTSDSSFVLTSSGINTTKNAMQIQTTNTAGSIAIIQAPFSMGAVNTLTGRGGFNVTTQTGGSIIMNAYGNLSTYTNSTTSDHQDLNVTVTGNTKSRVNILSEGTEYNAITLNSTGGIYGISNGPITFDTNDIVDGISIGTNIQNTPVYIGTPNSNTTIYGNLDVKGTTTSIESVTVTVNDNIVIVNNAPSGTANGGLGIKRWQSANNNGSGDVVIDTPDETGTLQGGNTLTTCVLSSSSNSIDNYYNDWWIRLTSGTGSGQVRKIKSYNGITKVATIYSTSNQTDPNVLNNTIPIEGLDFLTIPDNTSQYALFPCGYEFMIWDESLNQFAFGCSPSASGNNIVHYSNIQINNLSTSNVNCTTINNSTADTIFTVTLTNNSTTPVEMTQFPNNYGVYTVMVKPVISTGAYATFTIGRNSYSGSSGVSNRIVSVKGVNNEQLDIQWPVNSYPQLLYRPSKGINGTSQYVVKVISV